ncbi:predicted protein [Naegleria gruberi]|uniref:Predicted protein n=1 Tax=Naegleria gruberi TaxID=5762 RepID=D2VVF1_NAEGR|nr:uncharacterized protein NAEGRDRAFT_81367 [Naegleria gruberi]EFC39224.1 predicted protein [Naegleria gruberi]|eukprot:XP_002671968.1 predicted protein [Naegleria gruberi strain NEG-M]
MPVQFSSSVTSYPALSSTPRMMKHQSSSSSFGNISAVEDMSPPGLNEINETPIQRRTRSEGVRPSQLSAYMPNVTSTFMTEFDFPPPMPVATSSTNLLGNMNSMNNVGGIDIHQLTYNKHILSQHDVKQILKVFANYANKDDQTKLELWDLRKVLKELETPFNEDELFDYIQGIQMEDFITIQELVSLIENQKKQDRPVHDNETLSAFVAMGGNFDRTGVISTEKLKDAVMEFGFTVDIEAIIREVDEDGNGTIDFDEFYLMINMKGGEEGDDESDMEDKEEEDIVTDESRGGLTLQNTQSQVQEQTENE